MAEYDLSTGTGIREALLRAESSDTVRSRVYTGKPARLLKTKWTQAWKAEDAPAPALAAEVEAPAAAPAPTPAAAKPTAAPKPQAAAPKPKAAPKPRATPKPKA